MFLCSGKAISLAVHFFFKGAFGEGLSQGAAVDAVGTILTCLLVLRILPAKEKIAKQRFPTYTHKYCGSWSSLPKLQGWKEVSPWIV